MCFPLQWNAMRTDKMQQFGSQSQYAVGLRCSMVKLLMLWMVPCLVYSVFLCYISDYKHHKFGEHIHIHHRGRWIRSELFFVEIVNIEDTHFQNVEVRTWDVQNALNINCYTKSLAKYPFILYTHLWWLSVMLYYKMFVNNSIRTSLYIIKNIKQGFDK